MYQYIWNLFEMSLFKIQSNDNNHWIHEKIWTDIGNDFVNNA